MERRALVHAASLAYDGRSWDDWWYLLARESYLDPAVAYGASRGFVLGPADLTALGLTRATVRTRLAGGRWTDAGRGYVAPFAVPALEHEHAVRTAAVARRRPNDVPSGRSAAVLHGLPVVTLPPRPQTTARSGRVGLGAADGAHVSVPRSAPRRSILGTGCP